MKKQFNTTDNPRFVWNIGAIQEVHPDMPEQDENTVLWDRQEKKPVLTFHSEYQNAFCMETTRSAADSPFTSAEKWFNSLTNNELQSEGVEETKCACCGVIMLDCPDEPGRICVNMRCTNNPAP